MRMSPHDDPGWPANCPSESEPEDPKDTAAKAIWKPDDAARYITGLAGDLATIARDAELDLLAYLLDVVRLEAGRTARRIGVKDG
jgi:hypothetical protein